MGFSLEANAAFTPQPKTTTVIARHQRSRAAGQKGFFMGFRSLRSRTVGDVRVRLRRSRLWRNVRGSHVFHTVSLPTWTGPSRSIRFEHDSDSRLSAPRNVPVFNVRERSAG